MPEPEQPPNNPHQEPKEHALLHLWESLWDWSFASFGRRIAKEWRDVKRYPTILIFCLLVCSYCAYWITDRFASSTINSQQTEISSQKESLHNITAERDKAQIELSSKDAALKQTEGALANSRQKANDPYRAPIFSAHAVATLHYEPSAKPEFVDDVDVIAHFMKGGQPILSASSLSSSSVEAPLVQLKNGKSGEINIRFSLTSPPDSPYMGKPISSLLESEYVQIDFGPHLVPNNSTVREAQLVWVINNVVTLRFAIPEQKVDGSHIVIRNLRDGFDVLRTATP